MTSVISILLISARPALLMLLGNKCVNCSISDATVLEIDHINGDGKIDRKRFKNQEEFYQYYIERPEEAEGKLQLLCANHHIHKTRREPSHKKSREMVNKTELIKRDKAIAYLERELSKYKQNRMGVYHCPKCWSYDTFFEKIWGGRLEDNRFRLHIVCSNCTHRFSVIDVLSPAS